METHLTNPTTQQTVTIYTDPTPDPTVFETVVVGGRLDGKGSKSYDIHAANITHQLWVDVARRVMWRDGVPMEPVSLGQPWHRHSQRYKRSSIL